MGHLVIDRSINSINLPSLCLLKHRTAAHNLQSCTTFEFSIQPGTYSTFQV